MKTKSKTYQIRYNNHSKDNENERWRLIENGNEILVSDIYIDGHTHTTKDWLEEIQDYKWHISCVGHCEIRSNCAYITTIKEESVLIRHILKTVSYRILGTLTTVGVAYSLGATIQMSALLGVGELVMKPFLYFAHERLWYKYVRIKK
jgi:uncharacterized membrane protein